MIDTCNNGSTDIFVDIVSIEYMTVKTKGIGCWNGKASLFFRQSHFPTHLNKPKPIFSAFLSCLCGPEFKVHSRLSSCRPQVPYLCHLGREFFLHSYDTKVFALVSCNYGRWYPIFNF
ncbi:hypothetical protein K7X08_005316 [Anisodus acutangulus]|uniref:Uncharacterized protein n=1 Tax=Anisodus acutangulus TaxID=402998 RepID=A0A9Q1R4V7_9SOLA|nr:hypothetical protein K7X08_005316 [Anisodus acutangulus]